MKKNLVFIMTTLIVVIAVFAHKKDPEYLKARRNGGDLRMIVSAVDDDGNAVSNATVHVLMGMNFREKAYFINGITDYQGQFVIEGKTTGNEIEIEVTKDGYFITRSRCKLDAKGVVVEANYGFVRAMPIEGGYGGKAKMFINYRFNPTPNDTNLEPK